MLPTLFDPYKAAHNQAEFDRLLEATGLVELVGSLTENDLHGGKSLKVFFFEPLQELSIFGTGYNRDWFPSDDGGVILLNKGDVFTAPDDYEASKESCFFVRLLHEIGHYDAFRTGLNDKCELLAWFLAAKICPWPIPEDWGKHRRFSLASYQLQWPQPEPDDSFECAVQKCKHDGRTIWQKSQS
jgi:hypothetical protein